jgi:cobalt-zinc-cadmium efflux system protein
VARELATLPGVQAVHDLHVWKISSGQAALTAHLDVTDLADWPNLLERSRLCLRENFNIRHFTLQPELIHGIRQPYQPVITIVSQK